MIHRDRNLSKLLDSNSSFLILGPRGTGKSTMIKNFLSKKGNILEIDLLRSNNFGRYLKNPQLLSEEIEYKLSQNKAEILYVFIDEIQKIPVLLDEVHALIEQFKDKVSFILTGSSARKLKKSGANLLASRAISKKLFPFSYREQSKEFNLSEVLQWGQLPIIYKRDQSLKTEALKSYVDTYLREEVLQEGLVRNLESFNLFLDLAGQLNGEIINYSKMGKQLSVAHTTVKEYYQILIDTLLAYSLPGWAQSVKKQIIKSPKIYLFDTGIINALRGELTAEINFNSVRVGKIFETFIINEIIKEIEYQNLFFKLFHWKSKDGDEVDLVLAKNQFSAPIAIEIKSAEVILKEDLKSLKVFKTENPSAVLYCISRTPKAYMIDDVTILPWQEGVLLEWLR